MLSLLKPRPCTCCCGLETCWLTSAVCNTLSMDKYLVQLHLTKRNYPFNVKLLWLALGRETRWRRTLKCLKVGTVLNTALWGKSCVLWPIHHLDLPPDSAIQERFLLFSHRTLVTWSQPPKMRGFARIAGLSLRRIRMNFGELLCVGRRRNRTWEQPVEPKLFLNLNKMWR